MPKHLPEDDADISDLIGYLRLCTDSMLQDFEMNRLGKSAQLVKHLGETLRKAVNAQSEALLARALRENRKAVNGTRKPVRPMDLPTLALPEVSDETTE